MRSIEWHLNYKHMTLNSIPGWHAMRLSVVSIMSDCYVATSVVADSSTGSDDLISLPKTLKRAAWGCHVGVGGKQKGGKQAGGNR